MDLPVHLADLLQPGDKVRLRINVCDNVMEDVNGVLWYLDNPWHEKTVQHPRDCDHSEEICPVCAPWWEIDYEVQIGF